VRKEAARALGGAALRARGLSKGWKLEVRVNLLNGREKLEWASLGFNTETESIVKVMVSGRLRERWLSWREAKVTREREGSEESDGIYSKGDGK